MVAPELVPELVIGNGTTKSTPSLSRKGTLNPFGGVVEYLGEGAWDIFLDKLLDADYRVIISWEDNRTKVALYRLSVPSDEGHENSTGEAPK